MFPPASGKKRSPNEQQRIVAKIRMSKCNVSLVNAKWKMHWSLVNLYLQIQCVPKRFIIIMQAKSSFNLGVLKSLYMKTKDSDFCKKEIVCFLL